MSYIKTLFKTTQYLKDTLPELGDFIQRVNHDNPHGFIRENENLKRTMWTEQCYLNFPILYLSSLCLNKYAQNCGCDTFIFATRDGCHFHRIYKALFPDANVHYFNCSRLMFETATYNDHPSYDRYVKSIVKDVDRTIYVDIHGSGKRVLDYFFKTFGDFCHCFLISTGAHNYSGMPPVTQHAHREEKFVNIVFNVRGSPIEMLNYDKVGTMIGYSPLCGPVRDQLEYPLPLVEIYHSCIDFILTKLTPFKRKDIDYHIIPPLIRRIFKRIREERPIIHKVFEHISRHTMPNIISIADLSFGDIISSAGVYGIIWNVTVANKPFALKMVVLTSGSDNEEEIFEIPFVKDIIQNKKRMLPEAFEHEVQQLRNLAQLGLAPKVYKHWICTLYSTHYGFIIMDKVDCSLKDIIVKRDLTKDESKIVHSLVDRLHHEYGCHGDLKPSNIGVYLTGSNVDRCLLLDTQKTHSKDEIPDDKWEHAQVRDRFTYNQHYRQNRG